MRERARSGRRLRALHVNHGLRGSDADADEGLVRDQCRTHGVPLRVLCADPSVLRQGNLQHQAHCFRRTCLLDEREEGEWILTAHHAADQTESLLAALLHAKLPWGLAGILPLDKPWLRPLLSVSRSELLAWALANGLTWREDKSNWDSSYERNYIRHAIAAPLRDRLGEELEQIFGRISCQVAAARESLQQCSEEVLDNSTLGKIEDCITLARAPILQYHDLIVRELLLRLSRRLAFWPRPPIQQRLQEIVDFMRQGSPGKWKALDAQWELSLSRGRVQIHRGLPELPAEAGLAATPLTYGLGRFFVAEAPVSNGATSLCLSDDQLNRARLRRWSAGDRVRLSCTSGKSVADLLSAAGLTRYEKACQPVVELDRKILWIPGVAAAWREPDMEFISSNGIRYESFAHRQHDLRGLD